MLNSRRVARELALLTMAQVTNRNEKEAPSLGDMLGRAADMLATEARDRLKEAAAELVRSEHVLHEKYLEITEEPLRRKDLEEALAAIDKAQEAAELIGSAIELPAMVALSGADDVRELLALTPSFRLLVAHGYSDMVTPYADSRYVLDHIPPGVEGERAELRLYRGGHMFYTDPESRKAFTADARTMYPAP